jgi:hypothetical protein
MDFQMVIDDLNKIAEKERAARKKTSSAAAWPPAACRPLRRRQKKLEKAVADAGLQGRGGSARRRLHETLLRRPAGGRPIRRNALYEKVTPETRRRSSPRSKAARPTSSAAIPTRRFSKTIVHRAGQQRRD